VPTYLHVLRPSANPQDLLYEDTISSDHWLFRIKILTEISCSVNTYSCSVFLSRVSMQCNAILFYQFCLSARPSVQRRYCVSNEWMYRHIFWRFDFSCFF